MSPRARPGARAGRDWAWWAAVAGLAASGAGFWCLLLWDAGGETPALWYAVVTGAGLLFCLTMMSNEAPMPTAPACPLLPPVGGATALGGRLDPPHAPFSRARRPHTRFRRRD
jgi:hypothetical protein